MPYCGHCGAELVSGDEFCRSCGTALADVAAVAGPPAETSARRNGRIALIVAAIVLGLLVLGGVAYLFVSAGANRAQLASSTTGTATSTAAGTGATTTVAGGGSGVGTVTPPSTTTKPAVVPKPPKPNPDANDVTHQATFIKKTGVADGGDHTMTFDYVQFLTGSAAIHAATAHGDTVDNDFYVVNDNPKLRTFPVSSGVLIKLHPNDGPQYSRIFDLAEF